MDFASPDLCLKIYELTKWGHNFKSDPTGDLYAFDKSGSALGLCSRGDWHVLEMETLVPAYPLGYLMRKLPRHIDDYWLRMITPFTTDWRFDYFNESSNKRLWSNIDNKVDSMCVADSPEDAAAKLVLILLEKGAIKLP